jgi:hypothetical protein
MSAGAQNAPARRRQHSARQSSHSRTRPTDSRRKLVRGLERHDWLRRGLRVGLASRGVVYLVLAYLVARISLGALDGPGTRDAASGPGVAQAIAQQTGGQAVLVVLAVGLLLYALFSLVDALLHHDAEAPAAKRWGDRALSAWGFVVYGVFSGYSFVTATSPPKGQTAPKSHRQDAEWSAKVLGWPGGQFWLALLGFVLLVIAAFLLSRTVRRSFRDRLPRDDMDLRMWRLAVVLGTCGYFGRALLLGIVGWYVVSAAIENDPNHGQGVDGSVRMLASSTAGPPLLWVLAIALLLYGGYMFVEARYRRVG